MIMHVSYKLPESAEMRIESKPCGTTFVLGDRGIISVVCLIVISQVVSHLSATL